MIPALVVLACARLDLGPVPGRMLMDTLENLVQKIRTAYDDSPVEYFVIRLHKIFWTDQGSSDSPHFWTATSEIIELCR